MIMKRELTVILPKELGEEYDVEYEVECNKVTANIRKKFDFDRIQFINYYANLHPIDEKLKEYGIHTNNLEFFVSEYLLLTLPHSHRQVFAVDIADALGIDDDRVRCVQPHKCYAILKKKNCKE